VGKLEGNLIKESWVTASQLLAAKEEQKKNKKSLFSCLVKLGFVNEETLYMFYAQQALIPFVRVSDYCLNSGLVNLFPESMYRENLFVPLFKVESTLYVCLANPLDADLINTLSIKTELDINPMFAVPSAILEAINRFFGPDDKFVNLESLIVSPQTLSKMGFWRESERVAINLPVEFKSTDDKVVLVSSAYVSATASDVSASGRAVGIKTFVFLPAGTKVSVKFPTKNSDQELSGEVARANMDKAGRFFLGVKLDGVNEEFMKSLIG